MAENDTSQTLLNELLSMSQAERISVIAEDVSRRTDKFRSLDPHDLAEALGVPNPDCPGHHDWTHLTYAEKVNLEEHAEYNSPVSEFVYLIESKVTSKRFKELKAAFSALDDQAKPSFSFLRPKERKLLEYALTMEQLNANTENGICGLAHFRIRSRYHGELNFEAAIEDDGHCLWLRTPYDKRDGKFLDLEACITVDDWGSFKG